ncbi:MAG: hypothetical protein AAFW83_13530 [Pseudomonadota bacterium]
MNEFVQLNGSWDNVAPYQITSITDDQNGVSITIEDNSTGLKKGRFKFSTSYGYRNFNEADLHGYWQEIGGMKQTGVYVASSSDFLDWAEKRCGHDALPPAIKHYMIVSVEDVFEILSFEPPEFEVG